MGHLIIRLVAMRKSSSFQPLKKKNNSILPGLAVAAVVFGVLAAGGYLVFLSIYGGVTRDKTTLCPVEGPRSVTSIVIDRTDAISVITKADIEVQINNLLASAQKDQEFTLFTVDSIERNTLKPLVTVCSPGNPDDVDPLYASKEIVRKRWIENFKLPLEQVLRDILSLQEAEFSPIMESIQSITITHFSEIQRKEVPRKIIIVSDLLQNSRTISFYKNKPNFEKFQESLFSKGLNPDLRNVDIEIWLINRNSKAQAVEAEILAFYGAWVSVHGGRLVRLLRLSGIN